MVGEAQRSGTTTLLFTDIVGSTELMERLGDEAAVSVTIGINSLLRDVLVAHGGEEIKSFGDGLMVAFASALDAVDCAVAMQRAIARRQPIEDEGPLLGMRVGLHVGEPIRVGGDLFGVPVVTAARVCNSAQPGQIVVTDPVRAIAGPRGQHAFRDLGVRRFRGLRDGVRVWEIAWQDPDVAGAVPVPELGGMPDLDRPHETATIMFADIVASTALTEELGDMSFRRRTQELDTVLRRTIRHHRGTPVEGKLMGDGVLAVFASARDAVLCALACVSSGEPVGLQLHLGIHAGDVIRDGDNVYGGAVNIASRISDCTEPGEILISETVRGLARTSVAVTFEDRGERVLKGVTEPQRVYAVRPLVP